MSKLFLYLHTVRYLRWKQIRYRLFYTLRNRLRRLTGFKYPESIPRCGFPLDLIPSIPSVTSYEENAFTFLNRTREFPGDIEWDFAGFGRLWTYNLNYFDYLQQPSMTAQRGLGLIHAFIHATPKSRTGFEPYPTSLRAINWIKFLSFHHIADNIIAPALYAQYRRLLDNLEYHLLGNHLLENGFALLFGACFFHDEALYAKAKQILLEELEEQILPDGGHFELSPMYHQILLYRVLDAVNLVANNDWKGSELSGLLKEKAGLMLGWLKQIGFKNGEIPLFNDAAFGIAPTSQEIFAYGKRLGLSEKIVPLKESGYRKVLKGSYEVVLDVGNIGPDYIPGHAHSDTFSFVLYRREKPFIVDTGVSTYEPGRRRQIERGTAAHNTVRVEDLEQSEVWGGFRVAGRAQVMLLKEDSEGIEAVHDGYKGIGVHHRRKFSFSEDRISMVDTILSRQKPLCRAFLHFHPGIEVSVNGARIQADEVVLHVKGSRHMKVIDYDHALGFHLLKPAKVVEIDFHDRLETVIPL